MNMELFRWRWHYFDEDGIISVKMELFRWRWHYFDEDGIISMKMALFRWRWHYFDENGIISMKMALLRWRWHYFDEDGNISMKMVIFLRHISWNASIQNSMIWICLNMNTCFPVHPSWKYHSNFLPVRRFFPQTQVFQGFLVSSIGPVIQFTV